MEELQLTHELKHLVREYKYQPRKTERRGCWPQEEGSYIERKYFSWCVYPLHVYVSHTKRQKQNKMQQQNGLC